MIEIVPEKRLKKYALATIQDNICWYVRSKGFNEGWELVTDIELATKAMTKSIMYQVRNNYENDMGKNALHTVVIPVIVEFSLVKEDVD